MIPAPFDYEVADSVESAVELLGSRSDAKLLAGGHSLIPLLRLRVTRPSLLVDVGRLNGRLRSVRDDGDRLAIGALARYADLERDPLLLEHTPLLAYVAGLVGDPQVRHRGTIGGSARARRPRLGHPDGRWSLSRRSSWHEARTASGAGRRATSSATSSRPRSGRRTS